VMLTGALLLAPRKNEELGTFFRKRFSRIGLPFMFWAVAYFFWDIYVEGQQLTQGFIVQGILTGPYFQFWYLYMLMGLYLLTPLLRLMIPHMTNKLYKYFLTLWFIGVSLQPLIQLLTPYEFNPNLFALPGYVGYFFLGPYLVNIKMKRSTLAALLALGIALTAIGTFQMSRTVGGGTSFYFQEYLSPTMILSSISFFLLLNTFRTSCERPLDRSWRRKIMRIISQNTLGIYLFHMMVIYALQNGFFGFALNGNTLNSIVGVPLMVGLVLAICLAVLVPLKKVPILKRFIS
jgi:surface polysaccharide O-acyltransferase-like enzyme